MNRQVLGEHLGVGAVLTWGPCFYYQSQFFRGREDNPVSSARSLLHYDLEVSGFPSSHAGHLVLLGLAEQDYPGTKRIEDWPTWDLPILRWGKSQKAVVGFAHSGFGLEVKTSDLPNYEMPGFDGIGANEYIVDVTYPDTVDFISTMDTPSVWELNIWYHLMSCGFLLPMVGLWIRLLAVPYRLLFPAIFVFCCIGVYTVDGKIFDVYAIVVLSALAYVLLKLDCEPAPLILGFILGPLMEENLRRSLMIAFGDVTVFVTRPISAVFLVASVALLVVIALPTLRAKREEAMQE